MLCLSLLQRVCLGLGSSAPVLRSTLYQHSAIRMPSLGLLPFFHAKCPGLKPKQTGRRPLTGVCPPGLSCSVRLCILVATRLLECWKVVLRCCVPSSISTPPLLAILLGCVASFPICKVDVEVGRAVVRLCLSSPPPSPFVLQPVKGYLVCN